MGGKNTKPAATQTTDSKHHTSVSFFQIKIKLSTGTSFSLDVKDTTTVNELKGFIFNKTKKMTKEESGFPDGVPEDEQNLLVLGRLLQPDKCKLIEYNIKADDNVYVILGIRGLPQNPGMSLLAMKCEAMQTLLQPMQAHRLQEALLHLPQAQQPLLQPMQAHRLQEALLHLPQAQQPLLQPMQAHRLQNLKLSLKRKRALLY